MPAYLSTGAGLSLSRRPYAAHPAPMDNRLQALAGEQAGAFSSAQALARGVDPLELRAALRRGEVVRVRRGAYVARGAWDEADQDGRYLLTAVATVHTRPGDALSHHAALAAHGLPLFGHDPARVDVASNVRQAVNRCGLWVHRQSGAGVVERLGVAVVRPARAIVRTALSVGRDCAVVAGDAALHRGLVTLDDLLAEVALLTPHQGRGRALDVVLAMDERSESVGESRTRLALTDGGLRPESQVVITDDSGAFVARVDFLVDGVVVEFDGRVKYGRRRDAADAHGDPRRDAGEVVWLEKRREDAIRRRGHPVERVIWSDLDRPARIGSRVRAARQLVSPAVLDPRNTPSSGQPVTEIPVVR